MPVVELADDRVFVLQIFIAVIADRDLGSRLGDPIAIPRFFTAVRRYLTHIRMVVLTPVAAL